MMGTLTLSLKQYLPTTAAHRGRRVPEGASGPVPTPGVVFSEPFNLFTSDFLPICHDLALRRTQSVHGWEAFFFFWKHHEISSQKPLQTSPPPPPLTAASGLWGL